MWLFVRIVFVNVKVDEVILEGLDFEVAAHIGRQAVSVLVGLGRLDFQHGDLDTYGNILVQGEDFKLKILDYGAWACLVENPQRNRLLDLLHFQLQYPAAFEAAAGPGLAAEVEAIRPPGFGPETRDDGDLDAETKQRK